MKTITFFSEKGGVGKSSFSIMYASWLSKHGIDVALADFNHRISRYRESEIRARNKFIEENPEVTSSPIRKTGCLTLTEAGSMTR
jgi:cellulose biosynthesis protein BcsQ